MDGNGGCCTARWNDGGHAAGVAAGYAMTKMDMIMLKFRPIAPKPMSPNGSAGATSDSSNNSPRDGRHAKAAARGRRKSGTTKETSNNNSKRCNNSNVKKRKSSSSDNLTAGCVHDHDLDHDHHHGQDQKGVTLLPLFPESPDLSPTKQANSMPIWLNFNNNYPCF